MGNLMCIAIARRLLGNLEDQAALKPIQQSSQTTITGAEGMVVSYAKCCCPIPGDDIIAYISQGKGLTVHQVECGNIKGWEREPAHYFSVKWGDAGEKLFNSRVFVEVVNHQGVLAKLTNGIATTNANILGISTEEKEGSFYVITLDISVHDRIHLANIMRKLRIMPEVQKVYRRK
jgi:GTP pyrophosphokinase/guanosine-3',5'-bis(diphosphate) 3'-pyrophosphohydrolase